MVVVAVCAAVTVNNPSGGINADVIFTLDDEVYADADGEVKNCCCRCIDRHKIMR